MTPTGARTPTPRPTAVPTPVVSAAEIAALGTYFRAPIAGLAVAAIQDTFAAMRGSHRHEATDIVAARATPVLAVADGTVAKLFTSAAGGLTLYEFSADGTWCFYYAHLDGYADGMREGRMLHAGDVIGYVGTTGNAGATSHLHFAIFKLGPERIWWQGTAIDPYPLLRAVASP